MSHKLSHNKQSNHSRRLNLSLLNKRVVKRLNLTLSQPTDQQNRQEVSSTSVGQQPPTEQLTETPADMSEPERLRKERADKLTRIMLESIHSRDIGIAPVAEAIHKVVVNFAQYATQFDHLAKAQKMVHDYAGRCMQNFYDHYANRAMQGHEDDPEIVEAICLAHDAMPTLLPAALADCIQQEERETLAQSIELERQRKQQAEVEQRIAEREESETIQREIEEAERRQPPQPPQVNAADITTLMISRMADLAAESHGGVAESDLTESLTRSLRSFFDQTSSGDSEYLTRTATGFVSQIRDAEVQRIRRAQPDVRAAMVLIKHAGKFITCLPDAIQQVLQNVQFNPEAPPMRDLPEDHAEFEEDVPAEEDIQGPPSSGTPPGPPPPWNPRETSSTHRIGRVQEAVQRIEALQTSSVPAPKWQGWKDHQSSTVLLVT